MARKQVTVRKPIVWFSIGHPVYPISHKNDKFIQSMQNFSNMSSLCGPQDGIFPDRAAKYTASRRQQLPQNYCFHFSLDWKSSGSGIMLAYVTIMLHGIFFGPGPDIFMKESLVNFQNVNNDMLILFIQIEGIYHRSSNIQFSSL